MKGAVLLYLALLLLTDLAEDGLLGKAKFTPYKSSVKTSIFSPLFHCTGKVNFAHTLPSGGGEIFRPVQFQTVTLPPQSILNITTFTYTGSSGGIPL